MSKKVILVLASEGFQPLEYDISKRILEQNGLAVVVASSLLGKARGSDGSVVSVDTLLEEIKPENYDGLFFIGGQGALDCLDNEKSYKLLQEWQKTGKPYGAICISPRILAKAGALKNKKATGWDGDGELTGVFSQYGVEYLQQNVAIDGNVITATGPMAAEEWGKKIAEIVKLI